MKVQPISNVKQVKDNKKNSISKGDTDKVSSGEEFKKILQQKMQSN